MAIVPAVISASPCRCRPLKRSPGYTLHRYDFAWFHRRRCLKRVQGWHRARRLQALLGPLSRGSRLLDVGAGHGYFVEAALRRGWDAEGLDLLSGEQRAQGEKHGLRLHHGSLLSHSLGERQWDVITLWQVLEYLTTPREALAEAARLLAPGGILVVAVPNLHAAGYERAGMSWVWCQKPFIHPWHYSAHSLRAVLPPHARSATAHLPRHLGCTGSGVAADLSCRATGDLHCHAGESPVSGWMETVRFIAEEALRIGTYGGYLACHPYRALTAQPALRASELTLVAHKKEGTGIVSKLVAGGWVAIETPV